MVIRLVSKAKNAVASVSLQPSLAGRAGSVASLLGLFIWSLWLLLSLLTGASRPWWVTIVAVAAVWVAVPQGLRLADREGAGPLTPAVGVIRIVAIPAALITSLAFVRDPGFLSAVLMFPWLLFAVFAAGVGAIRFLSRPEVTVESVARDLSLAAPALGAVCLMIARAGLTPFGLGEGPVTLIAACVTALVWALPTWANRRPEAQTQWQAAVVQPGSQTLGSLAALVHRAADLAPTAQAGLASSDLPAGYRLDEWSLPVEDFDNSCEALWNWAGHAEAGVVLNPAQPPIVIGGTFALGIPLGPLSVTGACRIVGVINETDVYGFGYSTLSHHAWSAEQSLVISNIDGNPTVTATVAWAPAIVGAKLFPRLTRHLVGHYFNDILRGIAEAEVAEMHYRMQELVSNMPISAYRPPVVVEVPALAAEEPVPKTGAELLSDYDDSTI